MKKILFAATLCLVTLGLAARAGAAPKIQFEPMVYDFGTTSQVATVTGVFKFKNIGDAVLKVGTPKLSCGCTLAELKPDTLPPGESGELAFTLHLGQVKAQLEKHITVPSNDPLTPEVVLTLKADYTPLYEMTPMVLAPNLPFGVNEAEQFATLTRSDGQPLNIVRLDVSQPWITAKVVPGDQTNRATARIRVTIHRDGSPRRFNEFVHIYTADQTNAPISSLGLYGQIMGEVSLSPEALYWSIADTNSSTTRPEGVVLRRVTIRSADGKPLELKNPQSTVKGIKLELVSKEAGQVYELLARLDQVPATTVSGTVSFETGIASQARIEVPVIVNVAHP